MKTIISILRIGLGSLMAVALGSELLGADTIQWVLFQDGKVWTVEEGRTALLQEPIEFPHQIIVNTNGTFKVAAHPSRPFAEGQFLGADGMLISPNGRIEPVIDHIAVLQGRPVLFVNGEDAAISPDAPLAPNTRRSPDGAVIRSDGTLVRVIDGQLFGRDGSVVPAVDTVTLQNGKVIVQKEGTQFPIGYDRNIMMNEGTKVFGNGRVVSSNGQVTDLTEGQIITLQGVVKLR